MPKHVILFMFLTQVSIIVTALTITDKQKCKISDSACMVNTAQALVPTLTAGIPDLGIASMDVMDVDQITVDLAGLKLDLRDVRIKGLKKAVIENIVLNIDKKVLVVSYHCNILLKGKYKAAGRLLILPITGDGDITMKLKTMQVDLIMPFEVKKNQDGKDVIHLKSVNFKYDIKDGAHMELTNLFNGNKATSDALHNFMNENWKQLTLEFGVPMLLKPQRQIYEGIKIFLKSQPLENLVQKN